MKGNHWLIMTLSGFALGLAFMPVEAWHVFATGAHPGVLYVSATDPTCGGQSPCFSTIQAAVNAAAEGDEIRVAAGTYTGVATATVGGNSFRQVVLITKSLTLQGGYSTTNWTQPNPTQNPTVIDASRQGRGISIVGNGTQTVTVAGFTITNGDYSGLGNPPGGHLVCSRTGSDCGGGLFAFRVRLHLRDCTITNNIASRTRIFSDGGGAYLWQLIGGSRVENTTFTDNQAPSSGGSGGGLSINFGSSVAIVNSRFERNQAASYGGGVAIFQPDEGISIENSTFIGNRVSDDGGALEARLTFEGTALRLNRVIMQQNQARSQGAAISLIKQGIGATSVAMTNVVLASNTLLSPGDFGAVVNVDAVFDEMELRLAHLTWAAQPALSALRLAQGPVRATLTNTLIDSAGSAFVGHQVSGEVRIRHINTLTNRVGVLHAAEAGTPIFEAVNPLRGNPRLDATHHLQADSAAIDAGVNAGVADDVDGDRRPFGAGFDIGADEFVGPRAKGQ